MCSSVKRQMWGKNWRSNLTCARTKIFVGVALLGAKNKVTKVCGTSRLVPVQPRSREV